MNNKLQKDEHMERLFYMREEGKESLTMLKEAMDGNFKGDIIDRLSTEDMVSLNQGEDKIMLTEKGVEYSTKIIRSHRIAERLIYDVLGDEFESGACEFEHIVTPEIVDSICILLGHPRECPHGMSIPEGDCCRRSANMTESLITPLTEIKIGQTARVAYDNADNDQQLHRINGLQIRPGALVKLHQVYPAYVIECEGAFIALDNEIVANISIWKNSTH